MSGSVYTAWLNHPDNEAPERVADRFARSVEWAREHVGPHRCVDGRHYTYSCVVSDPDPQLDAYARHNMEGDR